MLTQPTSIPARLQSLSRLEVIPQKICWVFAMKGPVWGRLEYRVSNVTYGGVTIGTFTGGSGGSNLVVTLNANADATSTTALINNLTYSNTDTENPTTTNPKHPRSTDRR